MSTDFVPLKYVASINDDKLDERTDPDYEFDYLDIGAVGRGHLVETPQRVTFKEAPSRARRRVRPGDTILSTVRTYLRSVWPVEGPTEDLVVSTGFAVVRPQSVDQRYLQWAIQSDPFIEAIVATSTGVSYPAISPGDIGTLLIHVPRSPNQQIRIADYLDTETARIDDLIRCKERMIRTLEARHQSLIMQEVFQSDADSGRLARLVDLLPGHAFRSPDFRLDGQYSLLRGVNVGVGKIRWTEKVGVNDPDPLIRERYSLKPGDLVIGMDRPVISSGMRVAEVRHADLPALLVQRVARLRVAPSDRSYIRYAIGSEAFVRYFDPITTGVSVPHISPSQILDFRLPIPSRLARAVIGERLDRSRRSTDSLKAALSKQIERLHERRQVLITAAVTGELEV